MSTSQEPPRPRFSRGIWLVAKLSVKVERYLGDCAFFIAPTAAVGNPIASLNNVLAGASALSISDARKATGQVCEIAMSVCRPIASNSYGSPSVDTAKYVAMAKAFDSLSQQGGVI